MYLSFGDLVLILPQQILKRYQFPSGWTGRQKTTLELLPLIRSVTKGIALVLHPSVPNPHLPDLPSSLLPCPCPQPSSTNQDHGLQVTQENGPQCTDLVCRNSGPHLTGFWGRGQVGKIEALKFCLCRILLQNILLGFIFSGKDIPQGVYNWGTSDLSFKDGPDLDSGELDLFDSLHLP